MKNKDEFKPSTPYKHLTEVEFAYKYWDWEFYFNWRGLSVETMTKDEVCEVLHNKPYGFSDKTLKEMDKYRKYDYAQQKSYENLTKGM